MNLLEINKTKGDIGTMHFIGIGGIGISGLAEIMHNLGYKVQGSDIISNYNTKRLENLGIKVFYNHEESNIDNVEYVIISSAIKNDNVEISAARKRKIPIISRAQMLTEIMRLKTSIAISGSHGKTTTTSLIASIFESANLNPTVITGGIINNKATNAYVGSSNYLIVEADESDATFIRIPSTIAVITNIDPEHLDYYGSFENLIGAFESFINNLPFYGFAICCIDHPKVRELVNKITNKKIITYGITSEDANVRASNIITNMFSSTYDVRINLPMSNPVTIEKLNLPVPGMHNVLNSLAAIAVAAELDFGIRMIRKGLCRFNGVKRRFTKTGEYNGITIIDDYAHHPVEVTVNINTARNIATKTGGKVVVIFQPHRFSRVQSLFEDFVNCFDNADKVYLTEIYTAGEENTCNISHHYLINAIKIKKPNLNIEEISSPNMIAEIIRATCNPNDIVLMMGAGSITVWANNLPSELKALDEKMHAIA